MELPHVILLPFPAQGHIKPMLMLAELLKQGGCSITFVNTEHSHQAMRANQTPGINFLTIPDGLPPDHPRTGPYYMALFFTQHLMKQFFKDLVVSLGEEPTCIISDGIMSFAIDVAEELGVHAITFRTYSATCTWTTFFLEKLVQLGEIPVLEGSEDMDRTITCIPGLENIIRRRDLPHCCRLEPKNPILQFYIGQASKMTKASALILNTFEELESPIISHLRSIFPTIYTIGPLHTFVKANVIESPPPQDSSSLIQMDNSCIQWLDSQKPKSVLYVSFGSVVTLSREELLEFWYGLVNSGKSFLWAARPDMIWDENGPSKIPEELKVRTKEMGLITGWAPQEEVLAHNAVGGFLTHNGWNSTLESIAAGQPMIGWPRIADQTVNSRCVSDIWKVGFDMKDRCDRSAVEKMVRELMDEKREVIVKSIEEKAKMAQNSVRDGGSSYRSMKKLIDDIRSIHSIKIAKHVD